MKSAVIRFAGISVGTVSFARSKIDGIKIVAMITESGFPDVMNRVF